VRPKANRVSVFSLRAVLLLTAALIALPSGVRADSAVGAETATGNAFNPTGRLFPLPTDPLGLSAVFENSRSPTGLLYMSPLLYPEMVQSTSDPDWWSSAWAEAGYLGNAGRRGASGSLQYSDLSTGFLLSTAGFLAENRKTAFYVTGEAQDVARDDQSYRLTFGKYGLYSTTLFYDSVPHLFSTQATVLWNGIGTGRLTLPTGLTPGASTAPQVRSALSTIAPSELSLKREKAGLSATFTPSELSEMFVRVSNEWRDGTRPLGGTFGYPGMNGETEVVEPIHYRTLDLAAGARFKGEELQWNVTYAGSFFHNDIPALVWDNPGLTSLAPGPFVPAQGRMALPPDNEYHTLKGDLAWAFTDGRFAASASYSKMLQDSSLIAPTISSGTISGVLGNIDLNNWNTVASLSRQNADAEIDTFNGFAQLQYNPTSDLLLDFEVRDRSQDNKTNYVAFNPLTGQYGYIAIDGGLAALFRRLNGVYEPGAPGERVQIRNIPFATDTLDLTAKASYRLDNRDRIELIYTDKLIHRTDREVPNSQDNRATLQYTSRAHEWGTFRLSYQFAVMDGDDYNSYPYGAFNSTSLAGYVPRFAAGDAPFTLGALRKYDVANRTEHVGKAQTNFILSDKVDFQLIGDFKLDDYDADYGLKRADTYDANAELNYQLSLTTTFNVYYSFQSHSRDMANINPRGPLSPSDAAGGANYPLANMWSEAADDRNHVAGAGLRHRIGDVTLDLNYTYTHSTSALSYFYASTGAFFNNLTPAQAGTAFPDSTFDHHLLETSVLWKYTEKLGVRAFYRLEYAHIDDFHYDGLTNLVANNLFLGAIPENYTAHVFGLFFQYSY